MAVGEQEVAGAKVSGEEVSGSVRHIRIVGVGTIIQNSGVRRRVEDTSNTCRFYDGNELRRIGNHRSSEWDVTSTTTHYADITRQSG